MTRNLLIACVAAAVTAALLASTAQASCIPSSPAQQLARASVVFDGVALDGPTRTGVQRFRVTRYLKGSGPGIVRVYTGYSRQPDGTVTLTSVSLTVKRNERWRIFGSGSAKQILQSNACNGSRRLPR